MSNDYVVTATEAYENLSYEQKTVLIQKCLTDLTIKFEDDGYVMMSLLLREANDRISNGGAPTG